MSQSFLEAVGAFGHIPDIEESIKPLSRFDRIVRPFELYGNVSPFTELTEPSGEELGCLLISEIHTGDFVPISTTHAIIADFDAIDLLRDDLPAQFTQFKQRFAEDFLSDKTEFAQAFASLSEADQALFQAAIFTGQIASKFFKLHIAEIDPENELQRNVARGIIGWRQVDRDEFDSPEVRNLSESSELGVCSEIAIFAKEVMRKIGFDMDYATGYFGLHNPELHSFLTVPDGRIIFDPSMMISDRARNGTAGLMIADPSLVNEGATYLANPTGYGCYYSGVGSDMRYYSCGKNYTRGVE